MKQTGKIKITTEVLSTLPLFSELSPEQLSDLIPIAQLISFKKNTLIFCEGEKYRGFYILIKGSVKVYKLSNEGKESILHLIKPGDAFGEIPLFEGGNYPVNAQNISDSTAVFFPKTEFLRLLSKNNQISLNMLAGFAKRLRVLTRKVEELTTNEVMNRFAYYIIDEMKKAGTDNSPRPYLKLYISKKNIASYIGTITETLSRILKKMQDEKIIHVEGKTIFVINFPKLKSLVKL